MDTSEQYIKMCDCPEIQEGWKPTDGDFLSCHGEIYVRMDSDFITCDAHKNEGCHWLPRQDQLQEMILRTEFYKDIPLSAPDQIGTFTKLVTSTEYYYYSDFITQEQLWLAFVMKEKFNKVLSGSEWIGDNETT